MGLGAGNQEGGFKIFDFWVLSYFLPYAMYA